MIHIRGFAARLPVRRAVRSATPAWCSTCGQRTTVEAELRPSRGHACGPRPAHYEVSTFKIRGDR